MAEQWLSIVEYARSFHLSDMTVRRRIKTGKLHAVLREGKYYIPLDAGGFVGRGGGTSQPRAAFEPPGKPSSQASHSWAELQQPQMPLQPEGRRYQPGGQTQPALPQQRNFSASRYDEPEGKIPRQLRDPLARETGVLLESQALLKFCETYLNKIEESEKRLEASFLNRTQALEEKAKALESQGQNKDLQLNELKQKLEDLELLVKIIEKTKK